MGYLRKGDVLDSIKSRVQKIHGKDYTIFEAYLGTSPFTRKPIRKSARSIERLRAIINDFYKKLNTYGDTAVILNAYQCVDARQALDILSAAGMNITLTECVRRMVEDPAAMKKCTTTVREAYDLYLAQQNGKSMEHQRTIRTRVGGWVNSFGSDRLLSEITVKDVSEYLDSKFFSDGSEKQKTTYNNNMTYIKTFMRWCVNERGLITKNPIAAMKKKTKGYVAPEYMKPEAVEKLFRVLEKNGGTDLAYAILSFFCGMRQEEIQRTVKGETAIDIDLKEKYIAVKECKGYTRGIMPRIFTIPDQALAWMQSFDFMANVRKKNKKFRRHLAEAAKEAKVTLPKNAGRKSFCTMFEAAHHDSNALSAIVGNTEDIRDRHYNGVAKPQEGRDYFAIMPSRKDGVVTSQASSAHAPEA